MITLSSKLISKFSNARALLDVEIQFRPKTTLLVLSSNEKQCNLIFVPKIEFYGHPSYSSIRKSARMFLVKRSKVVLMSL